MLSWIGGFPDFATFHPGYNCLLTVRAVIEC